MCKLHKQFGFSHPLRQLYQNEPLAELARHLQLNQQPQTLRHDALLQLHAGEQRGQSWVFIHALSGLPGAYQALFEQVDPNTTLYALQFLPEVMPDLAALVCTYADALMAFRDGEGVVLIGWSVGGVLAYALCNELERRGFQQLYLVMLDAFAPDVLRANQDIITQQMVAEQAVFNTMADRQARDWLAHVPATLSAMALAYQPVQLSSPVLLLAAAESPSAGRANGWLISTNFSVQTVQCTHQQLLSVERSFDTVSRIKKWVVGN